MPLHPLGRGVVARSLAAVPLAACAARAPALGEYPIVVDPVDEVCAAGTVDAAWAASVLAPEGLRAASTPPAASLCLTSTAFHGVAFREAVFGLEVLPNGGARRPAGGDHGAAPDLFLVRALNSRPFFAWVERTRNASPYGSGTVEHAVGLDGITVHLATADGEVVRARSTAAPTLPAPTRFEGRVLQPGGTFFYARLDGALERRPALPGDPFEVGPDAADPLAAALRASGFAPIEWWVRPAGRHAKTDTARVE